MWRCSKSTSKPLAVKHELRSHRSHEFRCIGAQGFEFRPRLRSLSASLGIRTRLKSDPAAIADVHYNIGFIKMQLGLMDEALAADDEALRLYRSGLWARPCRWSPPFENIRAGLLERLGRIEEALAAARRSVAIFTQSFGRRTSAGCHRPLQSGGHPRYRRQELQKLLPKTESPCAFSPPLWPRKRRCRARLEQHRLPRTGSRPQDVALATPCAALRSAAPRPAWTLRPVLRPARNDDDKAAELRSPPASSRN